jgi:hypothetical protein
VPCRSFARGLFVCAHNLCLSVVVCHVPRANAPCETPTQRSEIRDSAAALRQTARIHGPGSGCVWGGLHPSSTRHTRTDRSRGLVALPERANGSPSGGHPSRRRHICWLSCHGDVPFERALGIRVAAGLIQFDAMLEHTWQSHGSRFPGAGRGSRRRPRSAGSDRGLSQTVPM